LHQVWQPAPADVDEDDLPGRGGEQQGSERSVPRLIADNGSPDRDQSPAATRITLRPHDPGTGEEIEKREVVKGYEYSRGQFLTFTAEELHLALDKDTPLHRPAQTVGRIASVTWLGGLHRHYLRMA
jgi:hypothetical protein